jgi:hypothetical protein
MFVLLLSFARAYFIYMAFGLLSNHKEEFNYSYYFFTVCIWAVNVARKYVRNLISLFFCKRYSEI